MQHIDLALRFLVSGVLVSAVCLLAQTQYRVLAGVIMLFPAVTLVGYYFVGPTVDATQLKEITKFSMWAMLATFAFLATFYYAQGSMKVPSALLTATGAWCATAMVLVGATYEA